MTFAFYPKVKYLISFLLVLFSMYTSGQNNTSVAEITATVNQIDNLKSIGQYVHMPFGVSYKFIYDSLEKKLLKVIVKDDKEPRPKEYYFSDGELIFIKSSWGKMYFYGVTYSVGSTWKNPNDSMLIVQEREMAAAYRFLIFHKNYSALR